MKFRGLIFDFDGTVADSLATAIQVLDDLSVQYGYRRVPVATLRAGSTRQALRAIGVGGWPWQLWLFARRARRGMSARMDQVAPVAGMSELLRSLQAQQVPLALVSSNSRANVEAFLAAHALTGLFAHCEFRVSVFGKPRALRRAVRALGCAPATCLSVGDETRDIEASRRVGLPVAAVGWGFQSLECLRASGPTHLVQTPAELAALSDSS
jgi:phosphoglycolate phosphatase